MAEVFDFGLQQHKIKMDGKFFDNNLFAVAGDTGRRLEVQLLDSDNLVQNTTGISLRLNADVAGQATYAESFLVDATIGLYELDLPNGMLIAPGNWQFQWQIIGDSGEKLHSFAFMGTIGSNLAEGATEGVNFYLNIEDLKEMQEAFINGAIDSTVIETKIAEKLIELETNYSPKLLEVESQLSNKASVKIDHISRGKQYVVVDMRTSYPVIKVQYKYSPSEDRWVVLERCGLNELFSYSALYKNSSGRDRVKPTGDFTTATLVQQFDTDIIGPIQVRSDANATGDNPNNTAFTGGWHGYVGNQTGAPTARHESIDVYADGLQLNGLYFEGYVDELYIKTKSKIQGYNTRKEDGTGREILTQELNILVKEGKSEIHCRLITLESCTFVQYYGLQVPLSGGNSPTGATVHYVNGDSTARKSFAPNTSGAFATYPCDRVMLKTTTNDDIAIWIDNSYGLGTRSHISATKASAFIAGYKAYFYLISESPFSLGAGQPLEWHGGIAWEKSPAGLTIADTYIKLLKNGNVWRVMDFLKAGTEFETPDTDEMFVTSNGVKELKKSANIIGFLTNYFYSYSIGSNGYGEYWFNFKKE